MNTVLLVDDNPSDRALFRILLGRAGFAVSETALGFDALQRAKATKPELVVLDVNLTDLGGHEICRRLKADPATSRIPVLMLTISDNHDDVIRGLEAGADDYVGKDEPHPVILARIHRLVQHRRLVEAALLNEQLAQVGRLLAGIVHEIRGPLAVVRGHAELLQLILGDDPRCQEWIEPILRSAKLVQLRLTHLMAAVRAGSTRAEQTKLGDLLKEAVDLFNNGLDPRHARPSLKVEATGDELITLDAGKFLLVLINLLNNAQEAIGSRPGHPGEITIRVAPEESGDREGRRIEVVDNGPGIPSSVLPRVFEPFYTTKENGSGYGLFLSSEIVAEMGGRISAANNPEGGACFSLWIPLHPARTTEAAKLRL